MSTPPPTPNIANSGFEPLTPLDLLMPKNYISLLLAFRTAEPFDAVSKRLQAGLDATAEKIPWISGRICSAGKDHPEALGTNGGIHYRMIYPLIPSPPQITDRGSIDEPISSLQAHSIQATTIPENVWPLGPLPEPKDPLVFGASIFRFKNGEGVGLCVCMHHNAVDATGFTEVLRVWSQETTSLGSTRSQFTSGRLTRISEALGSEISKAPSKEELFRLIPEFSRVPPAMPSSFPSFTSQMLTIPIERLEAYKEGLAAHLEMPPSTNTVLCMLLWTSITRIRAQNNESDTTPTTSQLITAVNGRRRIDPNFSTPDNPYLGNMILYASAEGSFDTLQQAADSTPDQAELCATIAQSYAPSKINRQHIANVFELGRKSGDCSAIFPGWDLFGHKDLTVTSWADLDLYQMGWGAGLGRPEFLRFPTSAADGVCIVLPRKRAESASDCQERIEVVVMLKEDHMEALKADNLWQSLTGEL